MFILKRMTTMIWRKISNNCGVTKTTDMTVVRVLRTHYFSMKAQPKNSKKCKQNKFNQTTANLNSKLFKTRRARASNKRRLRTKVVLILKLEKIWINLIRRKNCQQIFRSINAKQPCQMKFITKQQGSIRLDKQL